MRRSFRPDAFADAASDLTCVISGIEKIKCSMSPDDPLLDLARETKAAAVRLSNALWKMRRARVWIVK